MVAHNINFAGRKRQPIPRPPANDAEQFAAAWFETLEQLADHYEDAIASGLEQRDIFRTACKAIVNVIGCTELQAGCWVRVVIAIVGARYNERVYTHAEMTLILRKALGEQ